jgi:hypothetical protein
VLLDDLAKTPLQASVFASWYNKCVNLIEEKSRKLTLGKKFLPCCPIDGFQKISCKHFGS